MFEYLARRLEAGIESQRRDCWITGRSYCAIFLLSPLEILISSPFISLVPKSARWIPDCFCLLQFLFLEPNASDPLNKEASEDLRANRETFKRNVRHAMNGGFVKGVQFEKVVR